MGRFLLVTLACLSLCACTRVTVHKDPGPRDKGIRYYRPKPYLFITPDSSSESKPTLSATTSIKQNSPLEFKVTPAAHFQQGQSGSESTSTPPGLNGLPATNPAANPQTQPASQQAIETGKSTGPAPGSKISIQMMYMPDFAEEYAIQLKPGLGIGELNIKLDNGWNLTSVGMKTDQQTDEIIKSTADLISSVGNVAGQFNREGPKMTLLATNIPFGFYEAVIATDPCGRKQLYGWRYIGFMPFQSCPVATGGMEQACCYDNAVYGMVFGEDGVLRFELLGEIPKLKPAFASTSESQKNEPAVPQEYAPMPGTGTQAGEAYFR